ncbi:hypothetical protein D0C36_22620 [Mucilaginibacter conchicola]|uniref:Outer membrane protein beta-barrel domain-containing protein n=1 Tax=Mucilaginibacter conchicola TaxID=2303333 RepID=A0A372NM58_9SPHI|nr:hypothetical protein [Mucilaginibacter conchicola]RFZ90042.1 hypothetical protein D0C36_22620 [Mucilaginibacter conchicola]
MKTHFKLAVAAIILANSSLSVKAQTEAKSESIKEIIYSAGVESGLTSGSIREAYKWSLGGSLQAATPVTRNIFVTVNAGYQNYFKDDNARFPAKADIRLIAGKAGLKYFPLNSFYVQAEAGADFLLNKSETGLQRTTAFVYAPQMGYQFKLSGMSYLDTGVRYERTTNFNEDLNSSKVNSYVLRLAYAFLLK